MQLIFSMPNARKIIQDKTKIMTIRKNRKDGRVPRTGETLYLKDGSRWIKKGQTGSLSPILVDGKNPVCAGVWPVEINKLMKGSNYVKTNFFMDGLGFCFSSFIIDFSTAHDKALNKFAIMDGWLTPEDMFNFFRKNGFPFCGNLIYWGTYG